MVPKVNKEICRKYEARATWFTWPADARSGRVRREYVGGAFREAHNGLMRILFVLFVVGSPAWAEEIGNPSDEKCTYVGKDNWQISVNAKASCDGTARTVGRKMYIRTHAEDATECAMVEKGTKGECTLGVSDSGRYDVRLSFNCYTRLSPPTYNSGQNRFTVNCPEPPRDSSAKPAKTEH